jgi:DNA-directed RNA polymerase specialized sigma24 family protein
MENIKETMNIDKIFTKCAPIIDKKAKYLYAKYKYRIFGVYTKDDIYQDLVLFLMECINRYDKSRGEFMPYFISAIWKYCPYALRKNNPNNYISQKTELDETQIFVEKNKNYYIKELFFNKPIYEKIISILEETPGIKKKEIAKLLGIEDYNLSRLFNEMRNIINNEAQNKQK